MNEIKEGHVIPANKKKGKQIHFSLNILHKKKHNLKYSLLEFLKN